MTRSDLPRLLDLRRRLHRQAELAGQEQETARTVMRFMEGRGPDEVISGLGGHGLAFIFAGEGPGPTLAFRSEMDGVPIQEANAFPHRSIHQGVSHKCGHEGHMVILAGLADRLAKRRPPRGRVVLVFQPAEETGAGASQVIRDTRFQAIQPDYIFAMHNLPGYPLGQVLVREGVFTCASRGMAVRLQGVSSHAAYPEKGISPGLALAEIIHDLTRLPERFGFFSLVTVIHARLGNVAFGTAPGDGEVMATLRSDRDDHMERLVQGAVDLVKGASLRHHLGFEIGWQDAFAVTQNRAQAVELVEEAARSCGLGVLKPEAPFRWSEDFGQFTARYAGALFCMGAGEDHTPLHNPHYDFPDELIEKGVHVFDAIVNRLLA